MKRFIYALTLLMATGSQVKARSPRVEIRQVAIEKHNGEVTVKFEAISPTFPADYSLTVTPVLYNGDQEWMTLEPLHLSGIRRNRTETWNGRLYAGHRVMKKRNNGPVKYMTTFPYESWMQYVSLSVHLMAEGCCSVQTYPVEQVSGAFLLDYDLTPVYGIDLLPYELTELEKYDLDNPFLHPSEDFHKRYEVLKNERHTGTSAVIFQVGSHRIDTGLRDNKKVLDAIAKAFELIEQEPRAVLSKIVIAGYSSPEGTLARNTSLGNRRAEAVKSYIRTLMKNPDPDLFELYNGREDWDALRKMVEQSDMPAGKDVLEIIDAYTPEQEIRKTKLRQLAGEGPYRYMLEHFYPSLRSAGYVLVYYDMERSGEETKAFTDEKGRTTRIDPGSPRNRSVTAINNALGLIVDGEYEEALGMLLEFKNDPRCTNLIGVCYMMTGRYGQAVEYFNRAVADGNKEAEKTWSNSGG